MKLRWQDVDFENGLLFFPETKNGEPREVPMAGPMKEVLQEQQAKYPDAEYVFLYRGQPINKDFRGVWKSALKRAGIKGHHTWHGNRRSQAVNLMDAGLDEQTAMSITGHKDVGTFRGYRVILRKRKLEAAARLTAHLNKTANAAIGQATS